MSNGDFQANMRETVTIVRPMPSVVPRGTNSSRVQQPTRSIRFDKDVLAQIDEAAGLLDMSRSAFVQWCARHVAEDVLTQKDEYERKINAQR